MPAKKDGKNSWIRNRFKAGILPFITLAALLFLLSVGYHVLVKSFVGFIVALALSPWTKSGLLIGLISVLVCIVSVIFFGWISKDTGVIKWLRYKFANRPFFLRILVIFPKDYVSEIGEEENLNKYLDKEVIIFFEETHFRQGYSSNVARMSDGIWVTVHFSGLPTPKTAGLKDDFRIDDPRVVFTGRSAGDVHIDTATWCTSVDSVEIKNPWQNPQLLPKLVSLTKYGTFSSDAPPL